MPQNKIFSKNDFLSIAKQKPIEYILSLTVIILIAISSISNTSINTIFLKGIISTCALIMINLKGNVNKKIFQDSIKIFNFYFLLITISLLTLLYSSNIEYGLFKIVNLTINVIILFTLLQYVRQLNKSRLISFIQTIIVITVSTFLFILIFDPFDQSRLYIFEFTRWSHVIFSRITALLFLILLILFIYSTKFKDQLILSIIFVLMLYQIYYANMRAATIGIILVLLSIIITGILDRRVNEKKIGLFLMTIILTFILIFLTPTTEYFDLRYTETAKVLSGNLPEEGGINARLIAYEKALNIIKDNPILGIGFGGFNGFEGDEFLSFIKYPHNIFLEFQVELGIFGTLFIFYFLFISWNKLLSINKYILIIWLFTLWLALFAKDISTNLLVFLPLIFNDNSIVTEIKQKIDAVAI